MRLATIQTKAGPRPAVYQAGKYVDVLLPIFGKRLLFPKEFIGHGDMARGGLLLQRAASGKELNYIPVSGPSRLGKNASKKARSEAEARHTALNP